MASRTSTSSWKPTIEDDDDYDAGSGVLATVLHKVSYGDFENTSFLPNLFDLTGVMDFSETTENPMHNFTNVKGANVQFHLYDILMTTIGTIVLIMNLCVIVSSGLLLKGGAQPRNTYLFLGNVAMADLVTSVAILFGQHFPRDKRDENICILQIGMIVSSTLASIWSVLLIGIDRFLYIVHALTYQEKLTTYVARWLIVMVWFLSLLIGFMPFFGWIGYTDNGRYCWFIRVAPGGLIIITAVTGCLPIFIITVLYSIILYHALIKVKQLQRADQEASMRHVPKEENSKQLRMFRGGQSTRNQDSKNSKSPKKFRAIMVVALTTGSFIITWVPYLIASALYVYCINTAKGPDDCKTLSLAIASPLAILGFLNSLLNPLIYAWWHKGFRKFVCTKVLKRKGVHSQGTVSSGTKSSTRTVSSSTGSTKSSRPTSRKISTGVIEGPFVGESEDTRL